MTVHIRIITPHVTPVPRKLAEVGDIRRRFGVHFSQVNIVSGPVSIESGFDEALAAPGVVARVLEAATEGVDAAIVDCFADPGLRAAREAVAIPVIGPGQASLHMAAQFSQRFAIITILESVRGMIEDHVRLAGLSHRLAALRVVDMPVREIEHDGAGLVMRLIEAAERAVRQDGADLILLGCTGFLGVDQAIETALHARGLPVHVISPLRAATMAALSAIQLRLCHSRLAYPALRAKPIRGFTMPPLA